MQTLDFIRHVLPSQGVYCVVGKNEHNKVAPVFVDTLDEVVAVSERLHRNKQDVYFACSTYKNHDDRTKPNAKEARSLWLDIDCGYDIKKNAYKDYKTKEDALVALRSFTNTTGLPEPTIVDSGRGLHVYWTFVNSVASTAWSPVAEGLKFLCVKHKLHADATCTADASRILRVPNTDNLKDPTKPMPVSVIFEGEATSFDDLAALIPVHLGGQRVTTRDPHYKPAKISVFRKIVSKCMADKGCAQIKHIMIKQHDISEPLWRSGLSIAAFCEDRDIAIHKISQHHPDYTHAGTEAKADTIPAPHGCDQFEGLRPEGCKGCRFKGTINSPIALGQVVPRAKGADNIIEELSETLGEKTTIEIPVYPAPYFRGKDGGVFLSKPDDDEDGFKIYDYDFYLVDKLNDPATGECGWFKLHLPQDGVRELIAPVASLLSVEKARELLNNIGIFQRGKSLDAIIEYMRVSLSAKQTEKRTPVMHKQFGWNAAKDLIVIGNREISAFGVKYTPVSEELSQVTPTLIKKGSYGEWKKAVAFYERAGLELRAFGFFCGFGSMLMPLFDSREKSAVVNLYNPEAGQGKTSVIQMMTSIYGNPDIESKLINLWGDTENSIINRFGYMNNLPAGVDEMTNVTPEQLHNHLKFTGSGRGKNRLGNGANRERNNDTVFNLINVVSSNTDFRTVIYAKNAKASGEMARFIQLRIERDDVLSKSEVDMIISKIFDNYGHAGEEYSQYLIQNIDKVKRELVEMQQKIDKLMNFRGVDRKYSTCLSAVFLGAIIAKRLNIHNIPIQPVLQAVAKEFKVFMEDLKEGDFDAVETLGNFLGENIARNALVINVGLDPRTGLSISPIVKPMGDLNVRFEPDAKTLYIPCAVIKEYLLKIGVEYNDFVKVLKDEKLLRYNIGTNKVMHKGLGVTGPPVRCLWINSAKFEADIPLDVPQSVD